MRNSLSAKARHKQRLQKPTKRAFGRSLKDFFPHTQTKPYYGLMPAEQKLLAAVARGVNCNLLGDENAEDCDKERWARINAALARLNAEDFYQRAVDYLMLKAGAAPPLQINTAVQPNQMQASERPVALAPGETVAGDTDSKLSTLIANEPELLQPFFEELTSFAYNHPDAPDDWGNKLNSDRQALRTIFDDRKDVFILEIKEWRSVNASNQDVVVRGPFIRFLALGGDAECPVHEEGPWLQGAHIVESIDLESAEKISRITLRGCTVVNEIVLRNARLSMLDLSGSHVSGISADHAKFGGNVRLRDCFRSDGDVSLLGAEIGGDFDCSGGTFFRVQENALDCKGATFAGDVYLEKKFKAVGEVRLSYAQIGRNLTCQGARFSNPTGYALACDGVNITGNVFLSDRFQAEGEVCLMGVSIGGDLTCEKGRFLNVEKGHSETALQLQDAKIAKKLMLSDADIRGHINFNAAHCGTLVDTPECWGSSSPERIRDETQDCHLVLDGFTYDRFDGDTVLGPDQRLSWVRRQKGDHLNKEFRPQPFEQLIHVYRQMGHENWARKIAKAKQHQWRFALMGQYLGISIPWWQWRALSWRERLTVPFKNCLQIFSNSNTRFFHRSLSKDSWLDALGGALMFPVIATFFFLEWLLIGVIAGFGYGKKRLILALLGVWLLGAQFFQQAAEQNLLGPANPVIYLNPKIADECRKQWMECASNGKLPRELRDFSPHLYSADVLLPFVTFGQEDTWRPITAFETENKVVNGQMLNIPVSQMILHLPLGYSWPLPYWAPRAALWSLIVAGWGLSLLTVGVLSGIVKKD